MLGGMCQPRHDIYRDNDDVHGRTGWRGSVSVPATPQISGSGYTKKKTKNNKDCYKDLWKGHHKVQDTLMQYVTEMCLPLRLATNPSCRWVESHSQRRCPLLSHSVPVAASGRVGSAHARTERHPCPHFQRCDRSAPSGGARLGRPCGACSSVAGSLPLSSAPVCIYICLI